MTEWRARPVEEARLLNPAFLAALIAASASNYEQSRQQPMPWLLCFLIPPLVLHARAREALPRRVTAHLPNWIQEHPEIRLGFPRRSASLVPLVREALRLGVRYGMLQLEGDQLSAVENPASQAESQEVQECFHAASLLGRWFARGYDITTLYRLLGVRP